jgi:hypothetical protein
MAIWKFGPALAAGNTVVLKPAPQTPSTTLRLGELALEAGLPAGVLNIVTGGGDVGELLASHPAVSMVSVTGSSTTGSRVMELASKTTKRVHLELGGKAPAIVFDDANLADMARALALGATTMKMPQGHHGANHPVKDLATGKVEIVSMNHGFAVDRASLPAGVSETHVSLFDGSNCGIALDGAPVFSVQYHPEAAPGPQDSHYLFERFAAEMERRRA